MRVSAVTWTRISDGSWFCEVSGPSSFVPGFSFGSLDWRHFEINRYTPYAMRVTPTNTTKEDSNNCTAAKALRPVLLTSAQVVAQPESSNRLMTAHVQYLSSLAQMRTIDMH